MGRTLRAPILKLDVNCMAAISNEKVSCTDVCITAGGCCGFAIGGARDRVAGGGGGRGRSRLIGGVGVGENPGCAAAALGGGSGGGTGARGGPGGRNRGGA